MIALNWKAESQHYLELTKDELVLRFDLEEDLPEGKSASDLSEAELVEIFHAKLESDREYAYQMADRLTEDSNDSTWTDTQVDYDDIEAHVPA